MRIGGDGSGATTAWATRSAISASGPIAPDARTRAATTSASNVARSRYQTTPASVRIAAMTTNASRTIRCGVPVAAMDCICLAPMPAHGPPTRRPADRFRRHLEPPSGTVRGAIDTGRTFEMPMRTCLIVLLLLAAPRAFGAVCANPQDPAALGIDLSQQASCDPLVPEQCMLPFPNDYFTVSDTETRTRRHVYFTPEA